MEEDILAAFEIDGLEDVQTTEVAELLSICKLHDIDVEDLHDKFMAWKLTTKIYLHSQVLTMDMIARFKRDTKFKKTKQTQKRASNAPIIGTPVRTHTKLQKVEYNFGSPASAMFQDRKDSGKVVATLDGQELQTPDTDEIEISHITDTKAYRYMTQNRRDIADTIADYISERCEKIEDRLQIIEKAQLSMITDEQTTIKLCGMVIMEGQKGADGVYLLRDGEQIQLDLSDFEGIPLYPGMICAVEGVNLTGKQFIVSNVHHIDEPAVAPDGAIEDTTLVVCAGPYFTSDNTSDEPILALTEQIASLAPHLAIFLGPFLDEKHDFADSISLKCLDDHWKSQIEALSKAGTKVRMIPSTNDIYADPIIPTPAIDENEFSFCREHMLSNPSQITANKWRIAATSMELALNLMKTELCRNPSNPCKFTRIGEHILNSSSMMPIFPAPDDIAVDYSKLEAISMEKEPNLLLIRSELAPFIKVVRNTLFINPGRLTKGKGGGSYAVIQMNSKGHRAKIQKL